MGLSGNLKDRSVPELLRALEGQGTSGVVRLRMGTAQGVQRAEFVMSQGRVHGAAIYRAGGTRGMGDALVDQALCSPEDATSAVDLAVRVRPPTRGTLAQGAKRVGVPYPSVVAALKEHIVAVARQAWDWRAGNWELVLEGFPEQADRDSAAARAFLLDEGLAVEQLGTFPPSSGGTSPAPVFAPPPEHPASPPSATVARPAVGEEDRSASAAASPNGVDPFAEAVPAPEEPAGEAGEDLWPDGEAATVPSSGEALLDGAPEPAEPEPSLPAAPEVSLDPPAEAGQGSEDDDTETDDADPGVDPGTLSTPGLGESALMEAEQLLDGDVLSVMLEMGTSAAAAASPERVSTGHLVLVDDGGTLASALAPPLREAGFVVHLLSGLAAAKERLTDISEEAQRPLVISDLFLPAPDGGGLMGGLALATHLSQLTPPPPVILLAETRPADLDSRAKEAGVSRVLLRPLRGELKKDPEKRDRFLATLFKAIDEVRPEAEWQPGEAPREELSAPWSEREPREWDVEGIERQSRVVEDLADLPLDSRARQEALWRETVHQFSGPLSRPEILLAILRFGAEVLSRGVLFTPSRDGAHLTGFGQFGVEILNGIDPDEAVRRIKIPLEGHPGIRQACEAKGAVQMKPGPSHWELYLVQALGGAQPVECFFGPVLCQGKLAALLYGDAPEEDAPIPDTTSLEVVLTQAGLALDRLALEERVKALEQDQEGERTPPPGQGYPPGGSRS